MTPNKGETKKFSLYRKQIAFVSVTLRLSHQPSRTGSSCSGIIPLPLSKGAPVSQDWQHHSLFPRPALWCSYFALYLLVFHICQAMRNKSSSPQGRSDDSQPHPCLPRARRDEDPGGSHSWGFQELPNSLLADAAHSFLSALVFQVENLVKTKKLAGHSWWSSNKHHNLLVMALFSFFFWSSCLPHIFQQSC